MDTFESLNGFGKIHNLICFGSILGRQALPVFSVVVDAVVAARRRSRRFAARHQRVGLRARADENRTRVPLLPRTRRAGQRVRQGVV